MKHSCDVGNVDAFQMSTSRRLSHSPHPSVQGAIGLLESASSFYVITPFVSYTIANLLAFSPCRLGRTDLGASVHDGDTHGPMLYVLHQLLQGIRYLHTRSLSICQMTLKDVSIDDKLCVVIIPPSPVQLLLRDNSSELPSALKDQPINEGHSLPRVEKFSNSVSRDLYGEVFDLPRVINSWIHGELSNFDYLMILNDLAGRNTNDPNHYPIIPWVIDFRSANDGYRDLTRTKYRLNKGDEQLDLTFNVDVASDSNILHASPREHGNLSCNHGPTAFHVSDFLSDISYYVYKARRTHKSVMCRVVRSQWVSNQYPTSLQRMFNWTPDECIPEFYSDPLIFKSMHDDLGDLELPEWFKGSTEEFVHHHRSILEGPVVSANLHHWIDLTFGYLVSETILYCLLSITF